MVTLQQALHAARAALAGSGSPGRDAELLLMHVCDLDRVQLITRGGERLHPPQQVVLDELLARRRRGEPVAYLTGRCGFWSLELSVGPGALIPRPETETLVERALERIPAQRAWAVADLGTGTGAVALAIARERPRARVLAGERAAAALALAAENARRLKADNVILFRGHWAAALATGSLDLLLSNPPYVARRDPHLTRGDVRFEPREALDGGPDGLAALKHIMDQARRVLKPGGWLLLEHGHDQADALRRQLQGYGYEDIQHYRDLAGHRRVIEARCDRAPDHD